MQIKAKSDRGIIAWDVRKSLEKFDYFGVETRCGTRAAGPDSSVMVPLFRYGETLRLRAETGTIDWDHLDRHKDVKWKAAPSMAEFGLVTYLPLRIVVGRLDIAGPELPFICDDEMAIADAMLPAIDYYRKQLERKLRSDAKQDELEEAVRFIEGMKMYGLGMKANTRGDASPHPSASLMPTHALVYPKNYDGLPNVAGILEIKEHWWCDLGHAEIFIRAQHYAFWVSFSHSAFMVGSKNDMASLLTFTGNHGGRLEPHTS